MSSTQTCDCTGHAHDQCSIHCHPPKKIPRPLKFRWAVFKAKFALRKQRRKRSKEPWMCVACGTTCTGPLYKHNCNAY